MSRAFLHRIVAVTAALLMTVAASVSAQVCGDADGSTTVTVTDGVQTLRAAASLTSSCTNATCDIDGNGSITVTDGVNVLRKAAGLTIVEKCPTIETEVGLLLSNTLPIFGALTKTGGVSGAQAAETEACDNVDGSVTTDDQTGQIQFSNCEDSGFVFDGTITVNSDGLVFDLELRVVDTGEAFGFAGNFVFTDAGNGGFVLSGHVDVSFTELGDFPVDFENITTDANGTIVAGSLLFDAHDSGIEGVAAVRVGFVASGTVLPVSVILDDQSTLDFDFDINTGELTPATS